MNRGEGRIYGLNLSTLMYVIERYIWMVNGGRRSEGDEEKQIMTGCRQKSASVMTSSVE
jgi:hypothetical protein